MNVYYKTLIRILKDYNYYYIFYADKRNINIIKHNITLYDAINLPNLITFDLKKMKQQSQYKQLINFFEIRETYENQIKQYIIQHIENTVDKLLMKTVQVFNTILQQRINISTLKTQIINKIITEINNGRIYTLCCIGDMNPIYNVLKYKGKMTPDVIDNMILYYGKILRNTYI